MFLIAFFQYYDDTYPTTKEQKEFEKNLFNKTHRANGEDFLFRFASNAQGLNGLKTNSFLVIQRKL